MVSAMSDAERLQGYVATWWEAVDSFTRLLEEISEEDWASPTDLAGWDVHAIASHVAHLEGVLAGKPEVEADIGEAAHVTGPLGEYTERGVVFRRGHDADAIVNEIRESATIRHTQLLTDPPADPHAAAPGIFGLIGWTVERLLRNRPLDVWMHEQDVRRAVGRPGGYESPAARHTIEYLLESLPMVIGKRVKPPAGTTVVVEVDGYTPWRVTMGDDGRARQSEDEGPVAARIALTPEAFVVLAGGRREPTEGTVRLDGARELAAEILGSLAVTP